MSAARASVWALRALGLCLGSLASVASACPVCFSAKDEAQRQAFFDTTVFLTLLPLALVGGVIYWIARRARTLDLEQPEAEAPGAQPEPRPR